MDEAIKRKMKEKKYIDINKALRDIEHYIYLKERGCGDPTVTLDEVAGFLLDNGTTDVVEVVRCKDCKHATFYSCRNDTCYKGIICKYEINTDDDNFFCSYGERKDEGK